MEVTEQTAAIRADRSDRADSGTDAAPTAVGAVCVGGSRRTEVTGGSDRVDRADSAVRADCGTDAAPTAAGAVCASGSRQTEEPVAPIHLVKLAEATELTVAQTLYPQPLMLSVSVEAERQR